MNKFFLKLKTKRIVFLLVVLFFTTRSFSQTTTIDYLTSGLSTTACNVFNPSVSIGGIVHQSYAGGVTFNSTYGLNVDAQANTTPFSGTGFVIDYNFAIGYSYDIAITASGDQFMYLNTSVVSSLSSFATASQYSCLLDANVFGWNRTGYGQLYAAGTGVSKTYNIPSFTISTGPANYLVIWATGGNPSYSLDGLSISKIVITKTAVTPSFTLPTSVSLQCGTTTPQTYTVTNVNGTTGITGYTWNLGATPNGWKLPNGSAAPATYSTGTTNSLSLTPTCGSNLSNISATVAVGINQYNTNQSTTNVTMPSLSISGLATFCSGTSSYSISNLPCNASVTWSATPASGIVSLSCTTCNSTTLTKIGDGIITLTATVSNLCGGNQIVLNQQVTVGNQLTGTITQSGINTSMNTTNSIAAGATSVTFQWPGVSGITCHQSSTNPSVSQTGFIYYPSQSKFWFTLSSGQSITVSFSGTGCGGTTVATRSFTVGGHYYVVSPNPASSSINIAPVDGNTLTTESSSLINTAQVFITDMNGNLKKQQKFSSRAANMQLDISDLIPGTYSVHIINGSINESHQVIITR